MQKNMMDTHAQSIFANHPAAEVIYRDGLGNYWLDPTTAAAQTPGTEPLLIIKQQTSSPALNKPAKKTKTH